MLMLSGGVDMGRLALRRHEATLDQIDASATPFVGLGAMLAAVHGHDLRIDAPVDVLAVENARTSVALLDEWFSWGVPRISAAAAASAPPPVAAAGLFFSRGLDSMSTLVAQRGQLQCLLGLDWRDAPFATAGTHQIWRSTCAAAAEEGLPLIGLSTNARTFLDPMLPWDMTYGVVLAALAQLAAPSIGVAVISASLPAGRDEPHGSHPRLDPCWSSSRVSVRYEAGPATRNDKAAVVADDPFASRWLKVCWERAGDGNCGRCAKCLMTMTNFLIAGRLEAVRDRFDGALTPAAVRATAEAGIVNPWNVLSLLEALDPADALHAAWQEVYRRSVDRTRRADSARRV